MKKNVGIVVIIFVFIIACNSNKKEQVISQTDIHKIIAKEFFQVKDYTYIRAEEAGNEKWIAAPTFQVEVGKQYYFQKGLKMSGFESKELNKTFETIYFLDEIYTDSNLVSGVETLMPTLDSIHVDVIQPMGKPLVEKENIKIATFNGITTIANVYKDLKKIEGKIIKVKGKVTKFNAAIMNKNWVHLQDGTDFNGEFDLTATTLGEFLVGDIVTLEGKVALNKDFGYGYNYKLILEEARLVK